MMSSENFPDLLANLPRELRKFAEQRDDAACKKTIGRLINAVLSARERSSPFEDEFLKQLFFHVQNYPVYASALVSVLELHFQTIERENGQVQQKIAAVQDGLARLEQAAHKQNQWLERLILAKKIQELEADPLWVRREHARALQQEAEKIATQIRAQAAEAHARVRTLLEQFDG